MSWTGQNEPGAIAPFMNSCDIVAHGCGPGGAYALIPWESYGHWLGGIGSVDGGPEHPIGLVLVSMWLDGIAGVLPPVIEEAPFVIEHEVEWGIVFEVYLNPVYPIQSLPDFSDSFSAKGLAKVTFEEGWESIGGGRYYRALTVVDLGEIPEPPESKVIPNPPPCSWLARDWRPSSAFSATTVLRSASRRANGVVQLSRLRRFKRRTHVSCFLDSSERPQRTIVPGLYPWRDAISI